uniref:Uncharacterized protein n=1 Tax=Elaeophora elaphi TaxID=1147741 RepID=A0A0R3RK07_9BILA
MCRKLECQTCAAILLRRMKQIGMVPQNQQVSIPLPRIIDPRNCRRLRFPKSSFVNNLNDNDCNNKQKVPNPPQPSYYMNALIERGLRYAGLLIGPQRIIYPPQRNRFWPQAPPRPITSRIQQQQQLQLQQQQRIQQLQQQQQQFQSPFLQPPPQDPIQQPWDFPPNFGFTEPIFSLENEALFPTQFGALEFPHKTIGAGHLQPVIGETITASRTKKKVKRRADPPILGKRYMISCVRRGEADDDNMLALCNACWTWRKLPADYFPPLLNELVCSTENEGHCLSGWGKCHQKYRNFDVLRKVNGNWQPTTISTATCCDCRIRAGTEIHPLVVGKNQN